MPDFVGVEVSAGSGAGVEVGILPKWSGQPSSPIMKNRNLSMIPGGCEELFPRVEGGEETGCADVGDFSLERLRVFRMLSCQLSNLIGEAAAPI